MMRYGPIYGHGYGDMMGYGGGALMHLFGVLAIVGIVLLVIWAVRASHGHGSSSAVLQPPVTSEYDAATAIARRRFASGEITKEQFDEMMRILGG